MKTITLDIKDFYKVMRPNVYKNKKKYCRKEKHKKNNNNKWEI
jgi:hypothetical protein